jgi:hypothetical protein
VDANFHPQIGSFFFFFFFVIYYFRDIIEDLRELINMMCQLYYKIAGILAIDWRDKDFINNLDRKVNRGSDFKVIKIEEVIFFFF